MTDKNYVFRELYEKLANEYAKENAQLYAVVAELLGLKPFYGTCNKEQIIWAESHEKANSLPAGANIYTYVKQAAEKYSKREGGSGMKKLSDDDIEEMIVNDEEYWQAIKGFLLKPNTFGVARAITRALYKNGLIVVKKP